MANVGNTLKNVVVAILHGELLMRARIERFFPHILYTFLLLFLAIIIGMKVEGTLLKVEANKKTINDLRITHAEKTIEEASLGRISKVDNMLQERGSDVTMPLKPATGIRK